jgi:AraC-like DNA-binding protein
MDPLSDLLNAPRARDAFLLRVTMSPPWSIEVRDRAPLTVVAFVSGQGWFVPDEGEAFPLSPGDVLLLTRDGYRVADQPDRPPYAVIRPGNRSETPDGESLDIPHTRGIRTWGNSESGPDSMLVGNYASTGEIGSRVLTALPPVLHIPAADWHSPVVDLIAHEVHRDGIGQASLLDRLLDALVVSAVQHWLTQVGDSGPSWLRADDEIVRAALALLHDSPAEPWTVASLARAVGISRAGLARRFTLAVGEAPMSYLASWRLAVAADLLTSGEDPVSLISRTVGYASPFTFSAAFKRRYAVSPTAYRHRLA